MQVAFPAALQGSCTSKAVGRGLLQMRCAWNALQIICLWPTTDFGALQAMPLNLYTARAHLQEHCKGTLQASCPHFPLHSVSRPARLSVLCMVKGNTCQGEGGTSSVHSAEHKLLCTLLCYLLWYAFAHMYWAYISTLLQCHISCDAWCCYATLFKYIIDIKRRHLLSSY